MKINPGYTINICQYPEDLKTINNNMNSNNNFCPEIKKQITKDKKVKILESPIRNTAILSTKKSFKKSILKSKNSFNKNHNLLRLESKDKLEHINKSNKSILNLNNNLAYPSSSLNVNNQMSEQSFSNDKSSNSYNRTFLGLNNMSFIDKSFRNAGRINRSKNNFLNLITHNNNNNNNNQDFNESKTFLGGKNFVDILEGPSLNLIEKTLQNKILDMGKEAEFLEYEFNPLELSINRLNYKQNRQKLTSRYIKDGKNDSLKSNRTFVHNNAANSNLNTSSSEDFLLGNNLNSYNFRNQNNINQKFMPNNIYSNLSNLNVLNKNNNSNFIKNNINSLPHNYYKINVMKSDANGRRSSINHFLKSTHSFSTISRSKSASGTKRSSIINNEASPKFNDDNLDAVIPKFKKRNSIFVSREKFRVLTQRKLVYDSLDDEEIIEDEINDNFYFNPDDKVILIVDGLILFFIFWNIIYKPLSIVLNNCDVKDTITNFSFDNIINIFIDILYFCDLIVNFFKAFYNFDEQLVTKSEKIILNYVKSYFVLDFICAIPYYSIIKIISFHNHRHLKIPINCSKYYDHEIKDAYQIIDLLKLIKLLKCISNDNIIGNYLNSYLNQITFFENWSFLMGSVFLSLLILHFTACLHIFISCTTFPNWIVNKNLHNSPFIKIYLSSIYFLITTVTSVGYGDIIGSSFNEICFQIILLIVGILAYSWLISSISNYVQENNKQKEIFNQKVSILNEIKLEHPIMTKELYDKIYLHLEYTNLRQKKDKSSLIDSLPHSVKKELLYEMYKPIIDNFNFFKNVKNSEFVNRVISKLKPVLAVKNDLLLDQGEIIEDTIFVKQGRLSLEVKIDTDFPEKSIEKLLNQEYFFGIENNETYQKSAFGGLLALASNNPNKTIINKKNLYNLYSGNATFENSNNKNDVKSIITNAEGETQIQNHSNPNANYIHLRILDIRKNEHFGALIMFLNKRSPLTLRVKTKKAELFFLKKIDAIEISTSYPNIWKRVNKKAFHNLKQIKIIMKRIIRHFCETYGIDYDFGTTMLQYRYQKNAADLQKLNAKTKKPRIKLKSKFNNFNLLNFNTFTNKLRDLRRNSLDSLNTPLDMFQQIPGETNIISAKTIKEKNIEDLIPKNFDRNNQKDNDDFKNNVINCIKNKRKSFNKKNKSDFRENLNDKEKYMDCKLSDIKIPKKNSVFSYVNHSNSFNNNKGINNNQSNSESENSESSDSSENDNSKSNKIKKNKKEQFNYTLKKDSAKYGEDETSNLMKFFGTPYYPEDINDEIYPGEMFEIPSQRIYTNSNNNNLYEQEFSPTNHCLLSVDTSKNNISKIKNNINIQPSINIFDMNNRSNNFTINNNYITNNVINNVNSHESNSNLSIFRFSIQFEKSKIDEKNKVFNFTIFKNSFSIPTIKADKKFITLANTNNIINKRSFKSNNKKVKFLSINKIDIENDKNSKSQTREPKNEKVNKVKTGINSFNINIKRKRNNSCVNNLPIKPKLEDESFSSIGDYTISSYDSNSDSNPNSNSNSNSNNNNNNKEKEIFSEKKKRRATTNVGGFFKSNFKQNKISSKLKIEQNLVFKVTAKYENLNILTKGKILQSKKLQKFIKDIIIKKLSKHNEDMIINKKSRKSVNLKLLKNKTLAKFTPKKFLNSNVEINNDKLKKTEVKSLFKKNMISELNDKNSLIPKKNNISKFKDSKVSAGSVPKRGKTKKKNDEFLLDYVNRNIRDDNAVLNNPGQFYNGFFNDIMKKVSLKKIPKQK